VTADTVTFAPSVRAYATNTLAVVGLAIPVGVALFLPSDNRLIFAIIVGIAAIGSVGGVLIYIARARVFVTPDSLGKRGFGATRWISRSAVQRSLLVLKLSAGTSSPTHLFLFAPDSERVLRLYGALWGEKQLRQLADILGVEQNVRAYPISAADVRALEPTALNWAENNPRALTGIVVAVFAVIAVVVAVIMYPHR
jgi:hypothetical protein